jgi:hypothetical protein
MTEHIETDELQGFRRGDLPPARVGAVADHLATCLGCRALAARVAGGPAAETLRLSLAGTPEHPDADALGDFVAGNRDEAIAQHVMLCSMCRAEVDDLERFRARLEGERPPGQMPPPRPMSHGWLLAAAAALAVAVTGVIALRVHTPGPGTPPRTGGPITVRPVPPPPPPVVPRSAFWNVLVADASAAGRLAPPPFYREIRRRTEEVRGTDNPAARMNLQPSGVVVESDRPRFTWPAGKGRAVVSVFQGMRRVAQSPPLDTSDWTPTKPLRRGHTYQWQVELGAGERRILPPPPDPPAAFHVMDEASASQLAAARSERPNDHLLLGVLYAHAGAQPEAAAELSAHLRTHPDDQAAQSIAQSIEMW